MHRNKYILLHRPSPFHLLDNNSLYLDTHYPCANHRVWFDHMRRSRILFGLLFLAPSLRRYMGHTDWVPLVYTFAQYSAPLSNSQAPMFDTRRMHTLLLCKLLQPYSRYPEYNQQHIESRNCNTRSTDNRARIYNPPDDIDYEYKRSLLHTAHDFRIAAAPVRLERRCKPRPKKAQPCA